MRASLIIPNESRDTVCDKDSWAVNCFLEREDSDRAVKRPGLISTVDVVGSNSVGQGVFIWPELNGPKVISIWDDTLWQYTPFTWSIEFAWDFSLSGSGSSLAYNAGTSYTIGRRVIYNNGAIVSDQETPNEDVLWFCVSPVTGVTPAYNTAAYPYWSRYPDKPAGPHPTMLSSWTGVQSPPNPGYYDALVITTSLRIYSSDNAYNVTYSGSAVHNAGPFVFGDIANVFMNYSGAYGWLLMNGYDVYPTMAHYTFSDVPEKAANDYSRSHQGI